MVEAHSVTTPTLKPRRLLRGNITYSAAKECETNILHELDYWDQETEYFSYLYRNRDSIRSIVAQHLGLNSADKCRLADPEQWMCGSFSNICIRVDIHDRGPIPEKQVIM